MFNCDIESRLSFWFKLRKRVETSKNPLKIVMSVWETAPLIPYNHRLDPYNQKSWPTPWDILKDNIYDDFTLAVMIAYTIKLTKRFRDTKVEVKIMINSEKTKLYNLVFVDDKDILNYDRSKIITVDDLDRDLYIDNIIEIPYL